MLANRAEIESGPQREAHELVALMEGAVARQEWERAEKLAVQVKSALLRIPESERAAAVMALSQVFERVKTSALSSRAEVLARLSEIRRGRVAQRAYAQPQSPTERPALR